MVDEWDFEAAWQKPASQPVDPVVVPVNGGRTTAYGRAALEGELMTLANAVEGTRNDQLNRSTFAIARLIASGHVVESEALSALTAQASSIGLETREIYGTINSALRGGKSNPRNVPMLTSRNDQRLQIAPERPEESEPTEDQAEDQERTSWWPRPIMDRVAEASAAPAPTHLHRDDGQALLYAGKVNGIIGESESGKSWIALLAIAQALTHDQYVLILDFEDAPDSIYNRLLTLQVPDEYLSRVHYADPDEAFGVAQKADLAEALHNAYSIILCDGVNAAMTLLGYDLNSNTDATLFATHLLRPLAKTGACVITVDHIPKSPEGRGKGGIGAQAKRAMTDGCALIAETVDPFGKGQSGSIKLTVDKDRNGAVRGISGGGKYAGKAHVTSTMDSVRISIEAPDMRPIQERHWKPTGVMEQVSRLLEKATGALSFNAINDAIISREKTVKTAIQELVADGYVRIEPGARNANLHSSIRPYREELPPSPTVSDRLPGDGEVTVSTVSQPPHVVGVGTGDSHGSTETEAGDTAAGRQSELLIPEGHSSCNRCGEPTPDSTIETTGGYCAPCQRIVNQ